MLKLYTLLLQYKIHVRATRINIYIDSEINCKSVCVVVILHTSGVTTEYFE